MYLEELQLKGKCCVSLLGISYVCCVGRGMSLKFMSYFFYVHYVGKVEEPKLWYDKS